MEEKYLVKDVNLSGLTEWMNENFTKADGSLFSRRDIQSYANRKHLPMYLGGYMIECPPRKHCTIKLYNVLTETAVIKRPRKANKSTKK
jgi:hypothetical protein